MAIETVEIITRDGMSIGLSKSLVNLYNDGDLTPQELARFSYAAWEAPECNAYATTEIDISSQQGAAVTSQLSYFQSPMGGSNIVSAYVNDLLPTGRLYCFNILLYTDRYYENLTIDNTSDCDIVTDIDLTACAMTLNSAPSENGDVSIDYPDAQTIKRFTSGASSYFHDDDLVKHWNGSSWVRMNNIRPYCVIANDSGIMFITQGSYFGDREIGGFGTAGYNFCPMNSLKLPEGDHIIDQKWNYSLGDIVDYTKTKHLLRWIGNDQEYESQTWASGSKKAAWDYDDDFFVIMSQTNQVYGIANDEYHIYPKTLNTVKRLIACVGLNVYIGNDKTAVIKPIIEGGLVVGYSEDAATPSEIDNITNVTGNNISPFPPSPPGPTPGYDDDPWHGISFSGVGVGGAGAFAKCYYMTSTELSNLRSWMNSNNVPEGFDPMQQIIGLSQVPVSLSGDDNTTVQFVNSSAVYDPGVTRLVDSGVSTQISMGTPKRYSLGSVNITRRMQERGEPYLDYDCQIELYLPLIGMFSLDTQAVMGRTITAEAVLDPISGTLAAYAYVTRDGQNLPIAYGSTTIGVDLPISAQQYSVSRAALKQANAQLGTSILSSTLSFIAAATAGGKGSGTGAKTATGSTNGLAAAGIREAGADYMKASQAGNVFGDFMQWGRTIRQLSYGNNTAIAGSFGGSTAQWSYPFTPYVKIIRPRYEKPSNYKHSQGVPCVQTKTVGSCTGFIQCIGVDVSGITGATDIELQAIQAALTNGVFAGGGS